MPPMGEIEIRRILAPADLDCALRIRRAVFIEEQGVPPGLEMDGRDGEAVHFLALAGGEPVGCARLRSVEGRAKIERMAVLPPWRRRGVGRRLMESLLAHGREAGFGEFVLHAQRTAEAFYRKSGFVAAGDPFVDAGIEHVAMRKL